MKPGDRVLRSSTVNLPKPFLPIYLRQFAALIAKRSSSNIGDLQAPQRDKKLYKQLLFVAALCGIQQSWADHPTVGVQAGNAAAITTSSANTLTADQLILAIDTQTINLKPVSRRVLAELSEQDQDVHSAESVTRTSVNLAWGFSDQLMMGLSLPYIQRNNMLETAHHEEEEEHEGEHHETVGSLGDASGIGDLQFYGQYQFHNDITNERSAALIFGAKIPTGSTNEKSDEGERLETELQPGSGSWDVFMGIAYSRQIGDFSLDTNLMYTNVSEGSQRTDLGDIFNYNLSFAYPLGTSHGETHSDHSHLETDLVFEINGEWRDRAEIAGEIESHSGGNIIYLAPGVRISMGKWSLSGSVGFPVDNLNGTQSEPETRVLLRLSHVL